MKLSQRVQEFLKQGSSKTIYELETKNADQKAELDGLYRHKLKLDNDIEVLKKENCKLENEIYALKKKNESLKDASWTCTLLEKENTVLREDNATLEGQIKGLEASLAEWKATVVKLKLDMENKGVVKDGE